MRIWFTSDLHFGHDKVARFRGFDSTPAHDQMIYRNWKKAIRPGDRVYVLGDLAMRRDFDYALFWLRHMPGEKHLISGNHDPVHPMHSGYLKHLPRFLDVFASVQPFGTIRHNRRKIMLSHFPYEADRDAIRYKQYRLRNEGAYLLHGHLHSEKKRTSPLEIHVGLDAWNMKPVPMSSIARMIDD